MFYAHSTTASDKHDWQELSDHLRAVATLAESFGQPMGLGRAARLAGLLHDVGKYTPAFQARLTGANIRVDHSTSGAVLAAALATTADDRIMGELVAYGVAGHHAGLPDKTSDNGGLDQRRRDFDMATLDAAWRNEIAPEATELWPKLDYGASDRARFTLALAGRMLFSCLVDADYRDTEAFYDRIEHRQRDRAWPALQTVLPTLGAALDRHLATLASTETVVNRLRGEILTHVRSRAAESRGLFTLTVPTGGGKTLASLAFALDHARQHGHTRIIYAIPFTSIIDQTAAIFRSILGDEVILEHHSAIDEEKFPKEGARAERDKLKLAMEDWAAPLVVTTNVQLFESLFAARPSKARKLHNIANSVIILDEAQTLPRHLLAPCVAVIDELARNWGCSIVLCTATQPALDQRHFEARSPLKGLPLEGRELAPDPPRLARLLKRVNLVEAGTLDNAALVEALRDTGQGLVIVNSRRHALDLYRAGQAAGVDGLIHLTTRQYAAHRKAILNSVRERLKAGLPCRVVATSLVEAGVDLDFPRVWRAEAGLDQIAQAAGRCNREGRRPVDDSIVTIFSAPDYPPPPEIRGLSGDMARMATKFDDLLSPAAIEAFFREVYWRLDKDVDRKQILGRFIVDQTGIDFAYRSAAEDFRMIESGMLPVIVARDGPAIEAVRRLAIENIPSGILARELQSYTVQVPPKARQRLINFDHVSFGAPKVRGEQFAVLMANGLYDGQGGLLWEEDEEYRAVESWVV